MPLVRLDGQLLQKIANRKKKRKKYVREQISKRASKLGISSEAAMVLMAKEFGIGTAHYQRGLQPHVQQEIRDLLPVLFASPSRLAKPGLQKTKVSMRKTVALSLAIEYLLTDDELRNRCTDLLKAKGNFDRVFRESTTVLEDRLRRLAGITDKGIDPSDLVVNVLHPNKPNILRVSSNNHEQEGFFFICKGLFQTFRNPTHHQLSEKFTREDALRFCGFLNSLLAILGTTQQGKALCTL